jgi:hypothetical protein
VTKRGRERRRRRATVLPHRTGVPVRTKGVNTTMAGCSQCGNDMAGKAVSCTAIPLIVNGRPHELIRWGTETGSRAAFHRSIDGPCDSCNTPRGGVHHPGCCIEQCPACGGQLFGCDCLDDVESVGSRETG